MPGIHKNLFVLQLYCALVPGKRGFVSGMRGTDPLSTLGMHKDTKVMSQKC
jgi:hypothetical protein